MQPILCQVPLITVSATREYRGFQLQLRENSQSFDVAPKARNAVIGTYVYRAYPPASAISPRGPIRALENRAHVAGSAQNKMGTWECAGTHTQTFWDALKWSLQEVDALKLQLTADAPRTFWRAHIANAILVCTVPPISVDVSLRRRCTWHN